jgi:hypothetical protein
MQTRWTTPTRRAARALLHDARGVAYVEFLLAFVPIFTLFLGISQLVLLWGGRLVVGHAASRAARAAAVVLDDDPRYYDREPRNAAGGRSLETSDLLAALAHLGHGGGTTPGARSGVLSRRATIELAAALTVTPLVTRSGAQSVRDNLVRDSLADVAARVRADLDVAIDGVVPEARTTRDDVAEPVTVTVRYRYGCGVPVTRMLVCPGGTKELVGRATLPNHRAALEYATAGWAE